MISPYDAARTHAAYSDRSDARGRIALRGGDRASYLQGLLTNDIAALTPGHGCYAAYLTAQGRMIADAYVYELGDLMVLSVPRTVKDAVLARLDQFIFSEDVQLGDVTATFAQVAVVGPHAADVLAPVLQTPLVELSDDGWRRRGDRDADRRSRRAGIRRLRRARRLRGIAVVVEGRGSPRARRGDRGGAAHRSRRAPVRTRHGRRDDSARGGHRVARDLVHERLLRRAGSDHPRAAPRTRPHRPQAGRSARVRRSAAGRRRGHSIGRPRYRPRHERGVLPRSEITDCAGLCAPRLRRAGHAGHHRRSGRGSHQVAVNARISSASAGGNFSVGNSARATHRISWPSCGSGLPDNSHWKKCSSTARSG